MGNLQKRLVEHLISLSPKDKREIANRIVQVLGGDPTPQVTGLPPRRGPGDGGLDSRVFSRFFYNLSSAPSTVTIGFYSFL